MIDIVKLKTCFGVEKNSETTGRMLIVYYPKINKILVTIASKNITWIYQNTEWTDEMPMFLSAIHYYYKKIFMIIPSFQKQTP